MPLADPHNVIDRVFAHGWAAPERLRIDEWAQKYRIVVGGPSPGPWINADAPHLVEIMRVASDPSTRKLWIMKSPQGGGTEVLLNTLLTHIDQDPDACGYFMDQKETARDFAKSRLVPTFEATPRIARLLSQAPRETSQRAVFFTNGALLWVVGAGSAGQLANKSMRRLYIDELDKYAAMVKGRGKTEGSALSLALRRIDAYGALGFVIGVSSPTDEEVGIDAEYARTDRAVRAYQCPVCGAWQTLKFGDGRTPGGVRFTGPSGEELKGGVLQRLGDSDLAVMAAHVRRTAWYECASARCRITGAMKRGMMENGRWIREGQHISADRRAILGTPIDTGGIRGFRFGWLDVLTKSWGDIAEQWVLARGEMTREFCNGPLGEPWRQRGAGGSAGALRIVLESSWKAEGDAPPRLRGYVPRGTPPGPLFTDGLIIGSCDVQLDRIEWCADAIGTGAHWSLCPSAMIDYGFVPWEMVRDYTGEDLDRPEFAGRIVGESSTWARIAEALRRSFPVHADPGAPRRGADYWFIDSSDRTIEVYGLCAWLNQQPGIGEVIPIKGEDDLPDNMVVRRTPAVTGVPTSQIERKARYRMQLGVQLITFDTTALKSHVFESMHRPIDHPGAWQWPRDIDDGVLAQLTSEHLVRRVNKDGKVRTLWVKKKPGDPNEHLDMAVYRRGGFCSVVEGRGLNAQSAAALRRWPGEGVSRVGNVKQRRAGVRFL